MDVCRAVRDWRNCDPGLTWTVLQRTSPPAALSGPCLLLMRAGSATRGYPRPALISKRDELSNRKEARCRTRVRIVQITSHGSVAVVGLGTMRGGPPATGAVDRVCRLYSMVREFPMPRRPEKTRQVLGFRRISPSPCPQVPRQEGRRTKLRPKQFFLPHADRAAQVMPPAMQRPLGHWLAVQCLLLILVLAQWERLK